MADLQLNKFNLKEIQFLCPNSRPCINHETIKAWPSPTIT